MEPGDHTSMLMDDSWTIQVPQSSTVLLKGGSGVMNGSKDFAKDIHSLFSAHEKVPDYLGVMHHSYSAPLSQQKTRPSDTNATAFVANHPSAKTASLTPNMHSTIHKDSPDMGSLPEKQSMFTDVLEQLATKEEAIPGNTELYTLPSMQFLESLLDEMDTFTTSSGRPPVEPPLYLPIEDFDLADTVAKRNIASQPAAVESLPFAHTDIAANRRHSFPPRLHTGMDAMMMPHHSNSYFAPVAASAANSPVKGMAHQRPPMPRPGAMYYPIEVPMGMPHGYEFDAEPDKVMAMSKSGRTCKVATFTGVKRKSGMDGPAQTYVSAPAAMPMTHVPQDVMMHADSEDPTSADEDGDEVSKGGKSRKAGSRGRKGRRTVCLNCGSHQTPQWRCGPLGPRTLCNACGVRYKKGLPLNCWPLRDGMELPAPLPSSVVVPPGVRIVVRDMPGSLESE